MSLSDCEHCWETPCVCGEGYRDYTPERAAELVAAIRRGQALGPRPVVERKPMTIEDYGKSLTIPASALQCDLPKTWTNRTAKQAAEAIAAVLARRKK